MPSSRGTRRLWRQDVLLHTDNILFHKEKFYSPVAAHDLPGRFPSAIAGSSALGIKSLALVLYFWAQMSEPKVAELLRSVGVHILRWTGVEPPDQRPGALPRCEKQALDQAGLASSPWQHLDDTSTRGQRAERVLPTSSAIRSIRPTLRRLPRTA